MEKISIIAHKRDVFGKKLHALRSTGNVPAIVYGQDKDAESVIVNTHEFSKIYAHAGHNTIIDLKIDQAASDNVLIQDIATDPVTGDITHADFYRVNMNQEIRTSVPLHFVGESPAVYQQEGTLLTNIEEVEVETLPGKLPANIEVDVTGLDDFEKTIHISDLVVPEGVKILVEPEELVCKVDPPRSEEEMEALNEDIGLAAPPEEGEEAAEGEEASEGDSGASAEASAEEKPAEK
jgi:large subunit ribosomal protein L25